VFTGVETIDVTAAGSSFLGLNHDIYVTNPAIFNDMRVVLELGNHPPDKRSPELFQPKAAEGGMYWLYHRRQAGDASVDTIALPAVAPRPEIAASLAVGPPLFAPPPAVYRAPIVINPADGTATVVPAPRDSAAEAPDQPAQDEPKAVEAPATTPAAATPPLPAVSPSNLPAVAPLPSPANQPESPQPAPPQAAPAPGPNGTTASIATPPKGTVNRKKRQPDFDPDWNTKPLH
jgi:hypothetical protein